MDEGNDPKQQQQQSKKFADLLKEAAKKKKKGARKTVFQIIFNPKVMRTLRVLVCFAFGIVLITSFSWLLGVSASNNSKDASYDAMVYNISKTNSNSDETQNRGYQISIEIDEENHGYSLNYLFFDKDGNEVSQEEVLENLKEKLKGEYKDISLLTESELKIIAVLAEQELDTEDFSVEDLKCLALFVKAQIAGENFDLRTGDERGKEVNLKEMSESDLIYGTLQAQRTSVVSDGSEAKYETIPLEFLEYGDEDTDGTFAYLINQKNKDEVIKYFSIDKDLNLLVAKWSTSSTTVSYVDENGHGLDSNQLAKIPGELLQNSSKTDVISRPIAYKKNLSNYCFNYGLLSDLLITTQNPEFCSDLCKIQFNSKIIINIKEELTNINSTYISTHIITDLTKKYVKYSISGDKVTVSTSNQFVASGDTYPDENTVGYGFNSSMMPNGNYWNYTWSDGYNTYTLNYYNYGNPHWTLTRAVEEEKSEPMNLSPSEYSTENGDLIVGGRIEEDNMDYTNISTFTYNIITNTVTNSTSFKPEISEIDSWFLRYKKEYDTPSIEVTTSGSDTGIRKGEYITTSQEESDNIEEINKDKDVKTYIKDKIAKAKASYNRSNIKNIDGQVIHLTTEIVTREDTGSKEDTTTTKYKYGEAIPDTTDIKLKNIKIVDDTPVFSKTYVDKDGNEQEEIGFLYIYDNYRNDGEDLFLQEDAEDLLFDLLENYKKGDKYNNTNYSKLMRFLLYAYDGIDRGVTNITEVLDLFKVKDLESNSRSTTSLLNYIFKYISTYEGTTPIEGEYYVAIDGGDGKITIGHGMTESVTGLEDIVVGSRRLISEVDGLQKQKILECINQARKEIPNIKEYQLVGLVSFMYNGCGSAEYIINGYNKCWDEERDNKYHSGITTDDIPEFDRMNKIIDQVRTVYDNDAQRLNALNELKSIINTPLYTEYWGGYCRGLSYGKTIIYPGLLWRKWGEFLMFQYGYNVHDGTFFKPLQYSLQGWDREVYESKEFTFPIYSQFDPLWQDTPFGGPNGLASIPDNNGINKTIGTSGCGTCAIAAIVSGFTGEAYTPDRFVSILDEVYPSGSYYTAGVGSSYFYFSDNRALINKYFQCEGRGGISNNAVAEEALRNGECLIIWIERVDGSGHIIAAVPASAEDEADGKLFKIIDPNGPGKGYDGLYSSLSDMKASNGNISSYGVAAIINKGSNMGKSSLEFGGITTQEEATERENYFTNEILHVSGRFNNDPAKHNDWDIYNNLPPEFKKISRVPGGSGNLQMFQCTWWANGRANLYLSTNGTKYKEYPTLEGNGGGYYSINMRDGYFDYGAEPRPNSIGCYGAGTNANPGHVFYVEGVTEDGIWISDCGSGIRWGGITFWANAVWKSKGIPGFIYLDSPR